MTNLIGHDRVWRMLVSLIDGARPPASLIFVGPPQVGRQTLAAAVAARSLGLASAEEVRRHPDILAVWSADETRWRETVAYLLRGIHTRPFLASRRFVLLPEVDLLSPPAAALLLKAIEDAPAFVTFLLTARTSERVPPTLRSRSFTVEIHPVGTEIIAEALRERGVERGESLEIAHLAGGRPGLALRLAADRAQRQRYAGWAQTLQHSPHDRARLTSILPSLEDATSAEEFIVFLQGMLATADWESRGVHAARRALMLRRSLEALALVRQAVPIPLVLQYLRVDA